MYTNIETGEQISDYNFRNLASDKKRKYTNGQTAKRKDDEDSGPDILSIVIAAEIIADAFDSSSSNSSPDFGGFDGGDGGGGGASGDY